jgi:hypothetical protein
MPGTSYISLATALVLTAAVPTGAAAQTGVGFNGVVVSSCILTVSASGVLGVNVDSGTELGSEQPGGLPATMTVVATGGTPTVSFAPPTMVLRPSAYTGAPTVSVKYSSTGGASQNYTSASSNYTSRNPLLDTITFNMKASDSGGFAAGSYRLQTTATCQQ